MNRFVSVLLALLLASPSSQETLSLSDLVNRPERWPESVTLAREFRFGGQTASAGQTVKVTEFNGAQLGVDGGNGLYFEVAPGDCDFLAAANAVWAKLSPAQRAVDGPTLLKDASLWPEKVTCSAGFRLDDGTELAPGTEYQFLSYDSDGVKLWAAEHRTTLFADLPQTDLVKRARERALLEPAKRTTAIAAALKGNLVDASGKPFTGATIDDAQIYVLYFGASWCGPCRKFSPKLVEFVTGAMKDNPKLATVLLSNDKENEDMFEYMKEEKMPWPAMPLSALMKSPRLLSLAGGSIPHLVIVDRHGLVLGTSIEGGRYVGVDRPFQVLKQLVAAGKTK